MKQRPIKFRAWHTDEYPVKELRETMLQHDQLSIDGCLDGIKHGNLILMQFTGLTDEKGNEVYEGDIILTQYFESGRPGKPYNIYNEISFRNGAFGIVSELNRVNFSSFEEADLSDAEVVGTVFTHAHLLELDPETGEPTEVIDPFSRIAEVVPIVSGNLSNWYDWQEGYKQAYSIAGFKPEEATKIDWKMLRDKYFNAGWEVVCAFRDVYYDN